MSLLIPCTLYLHDLSEKLDKLIVSSQFHPNSPKRRFFYPLTPLNQIAKRKIRNIEQKENSTERRGREAARNDRNKVFNEKKSAKKKVNFNIQEN